MLTKVWISIKAVLVISVVLSIILVNPPSTEAYNPKAISMYNLGLQAFQSGSTESALIFFRRATEIDPTITDAWYNMGLLFMYRKDYPKAYDALKKAANLSPSDKEIQKQLQKCNQLLGKNNPNIAAFTSPPGVVTQTEKVRTKNTPLRDKWALVVGISKFQNPKYNLKYAAKDARDFCKYLVNEANFKRDHVLLLLDEKATRKNIMTAFGDKFLPAVSEPDDLVVVFVSTHGTPAARDKGGRNYIVAYDTDAGELYATGVDMDELYRRIKEGVKTDRALIVMDTCYSGAGVPQSKGMVYAGNFDAKAVAQGCGHLVITSSSPNERSWESSASQNGIFTKYLLQALRSKKQIGLDEAFNYLKEKVKWEVKSAYGQSQVPQLGGNWQGEKLIISAPPLKPRQNFNKDLSPLMVSSQAKEISD